MQPDAACESKIDTQAYGRSNQYASNALIARVRNELGAVPGSGSKKLNVDQLTSLLGRDLSQVVSSAIVGVGSSERFGKVRWGVVSDILTAWIITIPVSGLISAGIYWFVESWIRGI